MSEEGKVETIKAKVGLVVPEDLEEGRYANYVAVTHSPHEFHIFLAQVSVPPGEKSVAQSVAANTVAHIIIPPSVMPDVIKVLSTNYNRYKQDTKEIDKSG